ncbi:hypothetical protein EON76_01455 [bacterium]|nr:MAG: hypothetical protein EON76_01455 [bacterium]
MIGHTLKRLASSNWTFPVCVVLLLLAFTATNINGSSISSYQSQVVTTPSLISGQPRTIRSDEFVVATPLTISQVNQGFPMYNPAIGNGQDMALFLDVPYKDWSALFRPQNLSFFIMPVDYAFALKWSGIAAILLLSCYYFSITLLPKKRYLAILSSLLLLFSPFVQWWYQSTTLLVLAYSLLLVALALQLSDAKNQRTKAAYTLAITYILVCFTLLLYPPFQLPCAVVSLFIFVAAYRQKYTFKQFFSTRLYLWFGASLLVAGLIIGLFLYQHKTTVGILTSTEYPGSRIVPSGDEPIKSFLQWPLNYLLTQNNESPFSSNQSESARFMFIGIPIVTILLFYHATRAFNRNKKHEITPYILYGVTAAFVLLLVRMLVPIGGSLYSAIGFSSIPNYRIYLGLGLVNSVAILVAFTYKIHTQSRKQTVLWFIAVAGSVMAISILLLHYVDVQYAITKVSAIEIIATSAVVSFVVAAMVSNSTRLRYTGLTVATIATIASTVSINPLQEGLRPLTGNDLYKTILSIQKSDPHSGWVTSNNLLLEELPAAAGARSLSGVYTYPQKEIWQPYFSDQSNVYNRFAHAVITVDDTVLTPRIELAQSDVFVAHTSSCSTLLRDQNINYIIAPAKTSFACFSEFISVPNSTDSLSIYKRWN